MENLAFVIEDNPEISNLFSRALSVAGFQVEAIFNGTTALTRLQSGSPSLVILDMHIPEINGSAILSHIRSLEHLKETKVIIATADASIRELHNEKADLLLEKPVTFSQMRDFAMRFKN